MKIKRKLMVHLLDASDTVVADWVKLGEDLEEFSVDMGASVESKANILGETKTIIDSYEKNSSVEPYYCDVGDPLFHRLQDIVDNERTLDELKTRGLEVHLWEEVSKGVFVAYREDAMIEVTSYGGDTTGYQIQFNVHYTGNRTKGVYDTATKTFIADDGELAKLLIEVVAGASATKTKVTDVIGEGGGDLKYKIANTLNLPIYNSSDTGYTALTIDTDLTCTAGQKIIVVESVGGKIVSASTIKTVVVGA